MKETKTKSNKTQKEMDQTKNVIIVTVCVVLGVLLIGGIIAGIAASSKGSISYVEMDFGEYGKIVIEVDGEAAPETAKNFMKLVKDKFYDGLDIFRARAGFVIQGGKNENKSLTPIKGEFASNGYDNPISHTRGVISMARTSNPNSATSQFFITLSDSAAYSLDGSYAAFGRVVEGMDVVDKIAETLMKFPSDSMGFVSDSNAITIVKACEIKNYEK